MRALQYAASIPGLHGLLLLSATARFCADTRAEGGADAAVLRAMAARLRRDPERTLGAFYARCAAPHPPPSPAQGAAWMAALRSDIDALARGLRDLAELDLRNPPPGVTAPTILLHGAEDQVVPLHAARALAAILPRARLDVAPGAGHDLPIRHPGLVADRILHFVGAEASASVPIHAPAEP
jgi:pimeloyl-ACP methyl ester carboxylesterase